jgi:hypothetical protein
MPPRWVRCGQFDIVFTIGRAGETRNPRPGHAIRATAKIGSWLCPWNFTMSSFNDSNHERHALSPFSTRASPHSHLARSAPHSRSANAELFHF